MQKFNIFAKVHVVLNQPSKCVLLLDIPVIYGDNIKEKIVIDSVDHFNRSRDSFTRGCALYPLLDGTKIEITLDKDNQLYLILNIGDLDYCGSQIPFRSNLEGQNKGNLEILFFKALQFFNVQNPQNEGSRLVKMIREGVVQPSYISSEDFDAMVRNEYPNDKENYKNYSSLYWGKHYGGLEVRYYSSNISRDDLQQAINSASTIIKDPVKPGLFSSAPLAFETKVFVIRHSRGYNLFFVDTPHNAYMSFAISHMYTLKDLFDRVARFIKG